MKKDQNRIELKVRMGIYEEATLDAGQAKVLPGALLDLKEGIYGGNIAVPIAENIKGFDVAIVLENALLGKAIHAVQYDNETILVRRPIEGDVYLIRAVAGTYKTGDRVYARQTQNGIYVDKNGIGKFIGWAQENFTITDEMVDVIDTSTRDLPSDRKVNGALVNLLRVRIGVGRATKGAEPSDDLQYTVSANGSATTGTDTITIQFVSAPAPDLTKEELSCSIPTGELVKISPTVYTLSVVGAQTGRATFSIGREGIDNSTKYIQIWGTQMAMGWWGVCYPDVVGRVIPTGEAILELASKHKISGSKRNLECAFTLNEADWREAGGTGDFDTECAGRAFFITRTWGDAESIFSNTFDVSDAFNRFNITINGTMYTGYLANGSPVVYDGTPYLFKFES